MKNKNVAQRTCIGCRTKKPKEELVRIKLDLKGNIILDKTGKVKGRGAYLCKLKAKSAKCKVNKNCLEQAIKKNAFKYAFKKKKTKAIKISPCRTSANCSCNGPC